jgi:hypothetical protein
MLVALAEACLPPGALVAASARELYELAALTWGAVVYADFAGDPSDRRNSRRRWSAGRRGSLWLA